MAFVVTDDNYDDDYTDSQQSSNFLDDAPIIGTWTFNKNEALDEDGNPVYNELEGSDVELSTIELKDDGGIVINLFDIEYEGTWEAGNEGKIIVSNIQPEEDVIQPVINTLHIYKEDDVYYMSWGFDYNDVYYVFTYI